MSSSLFLSPPLPLTLLPLPFPLFHLTYLSAQLDKVMLDFLRQQSRISHACVFVMNTFAYTPTKKNTPLIRKSDFGKTRLYLL